MAIPTVTDVERIAAVSNPVCRNLQITTCYSELSRAITMKTGMMANWCTFATWASRQAGQTIRGEDFRNKLHIILSKDPQIDTIIKLIGTISKEAGRPVALDKIRATALGRIIRIAADNAGDAVARGNKKVFEEIGWEFARFLATCFQDTTFSEMSISEFCKSLRSGDPPEGQEYLRKAFRRYYQSLFENDPKKIVELRFLANLEIGFHEQTRLQPEIAEALNAAVIDSAVIMDGLSRLVFNDDSVFASFKFLYRSLLGKSKLLRRPVDSLVQVAGQLIRNVLTEHLMMLTFPPGNVLLLGRDVTSTYPSNLIQLTNDELVGFLSGIDPTSDSVLESGATDWSDLKERLHYIADLFRCYHETPVLFEDAFTAEETMLIRSGQVPEKFNW